MSDMEDDTAREAMCMYLDYLDGTMHQAKPITEELFVLMRTLTAAVEVHPDEPIKGDTVI